VKIIVLVTMRKIITLVFFAIYVCFCNAQMLKPIKQILNAKKKFYISYGYHRAIYSKTNLHFRNTNANENKDASGSYNFMVYNAKASDLPNFEKIKDFKNFTVPQFNASLGFKSNYKNIGFEISYNHAKYVVNNNQKLRIKGQIFNENVDTVMVIDPNVLHVEHTDGANFWMFNILKTFPLTKHERTIRLNIVSKIGGGVVIPKTNITFFGQITDNKFHVAGYVYGIENGLQVNIGKHLFFETCNKLAFAYYTNAKVSANKNAYLTHSFRTAMFFCNVGVNF
jgi:hypothetical protein